MKTILSLAAALLISGVSMASTKVTTSIDFGRKSKGCNGRGVCVTKTTVESGKATAIFETTDYDTKIKCTISKNSLDNNAADGQVADGVFNQEEAYTFPQEIANQLGVESKLVIPTGRYPVVLHNGNYIITFTVTSGAVGTQ